MLTREEILDHVLALPPGNREVVAVALRDSLENVAICSELDGNAFYEELQRRSAAFRAGRSHARPAAEFMAEQYQKQSNETAP